VYEISTAEQLLGLSLAMENNANDKTWTQGKTFKLTADIDLNPGVDWAAYKAAKLNGTEYTGTAPVNEWKSLDYFYGIFDGNGKTISGVWALGAQAGAGNDAGKLWGVFGGKATTGTAVKNVKLDNGYVQNSSEMDQFGGIFGAAENIGATDDKTTREDGVLIDTVYIGKNFVVDASNMRATNACGGVIGCALSKNYAGASDDLALDVVLNNVVFAGTFVGSKTVQYDGCIMGQIYANWLYDTKKICNYTLMTDCVVLGTYTDTQVDGSTAAGTFKANKGNNTNKFTAIDCYDFGNGAVQSVPGSAANEWVRSSEGVVPKAVADKFGLTYQQTVVAKKIDVVVAEAYWTDATNGQFIANAEADVYEIATAEQLLGLSLAMENNNKDMEWTDNKTFVLTADIDLNPGVDWAAYRAFMLNGVEYTGTLPANIWLSLDKFYGTIDGQGHTISGVYTPAASDGKSSQTTDWGVLGGQNYPASKTGTNAIKNVILDNGYVKSTNDKGVAGLTGCIKLRADGDTYTMQNIYFGKNYTVDGSAKTGGSVAGVAGSWWNENNLAGAMTVVYDNVVFAGHFESMTDSETKKYDLDGIFSCLWRTNQNGGRYTIQMTDCIVLGTYSVQTSTSTFSGSQTRCYNFGNGKTQSIAEDCVGRFIETTEGVMPVAVADMLTKYYCQATVANEGKYSVRVIGEVASLDYKSVDFKVTLTDSEGVSTTYGYGATDYETAKVVYNTINAGGAVLTADDFNEDVLDGTGNKMYAFILDGLDSEQTYTLSVSTVWTLTDGSVVEGSIVKTITPSAWVAEA